MIIVNMKIESITIDKENMYLTRNKEQGTFYILW